MPVKTKMRYPPGLVFDAARHLLTQKLRGRRHKSPILLSLEPLGSDCCASVSNPPLSIEKCLSATEDCATPIVTICGREPLEYPEIPALVRGILERGKHVFLCTNGTMMRRRLHMIPPYSQFFFNVRLDGTRPVHDGRVAKPGTFVEALDGIQAAKNAGFFVVVTSVVYPDTDPRDLESLYEQLHSLHVDGYFLSPFYPREKLCRDGSSRFREMMHQRFREVSERVNSYNLMISPIYLEYLRGERELHCSAWASPVYGPRGWSEPCSKQSVGYAATYKDLLEKVAWENYGRGLNLSCENCQCHDGYETAALMGMNAKAGDFWKMLAWPFGGDLGEKRNEER